jgi:hypothetical protein
VTWLLEDESGVRNANMHLRLPSPEATNDSRLREGALSAVGFVLEALTPGRHVLNAELAVPGGGGSATYAVRAPPVTLLVVESAEPAESARVETARQAAVARRALQSERPGSLHAGWPGWSTRGRGSLAEWPGPSI